MIASTPSVIRNQRLAELRRREAALKASISAEIEREQKRKAKEYDRLVRILGSALLEEADRSPNFKLMLQQTLSTTVFDEKTRRLLSNLGWL